MLFQKVAKELTAATHTPAVRARLAAAQRPPAVTPGALAGAGPGAAAARDWSAWRGEQHVLLLLPRLHTQQPRRFLPRHLPAALLACLPAGSVGSLEVLQALFVVREGRLLGQLVAAMKEGRSGPQASPAALLLRRVLCWGAARRGWLSRGRLRSSLPPALIPHQSVPPHTRTTHTHSRAPRRHPMPAGV